MKSQDYADCWFGMVYKSMHPYSSRCLIGGIKQALNLCINSVMCSVFPIMRKVLMWHSAVQSTSIILHKCAIHQYYFPLHQCLHLCRTLKSPQACNAIPYIQNNTQKYKCLSNKKANHLTVVGFGYTAG